MISQTARRQYGWAVGLLGAVAVAVFIPTISYDFLPLDDDVNIVFNPHHGPPGLGRLGWEFGDLSYVRRYLPLGWLVFSTVSTFSQLAPWGYHAANILLHATNAMLLAWLLRRLLAGWRPAEAAAHPGWVDLAALFAAAWWALHPLRVEQVAWCSALPSHLAMTFLLGALLAHTRARPAGRPVAIGLFAGALLSYPVTLGAVIFFPALDWARGGRKIFRRALPFVVLTLLAGAVNLYARMVASGEQAAPATLAEFPPAQRLAQAVCVWAHYLWRPWWPFGLSPVYRDFLHLDPAGFRVIGSAALLVAAVFLAGRSTGRWLLLSSYAVVVFPFTGFTESPHFPHDRYAALPGLVMAAALGLGMLRLRSRPGLLAGTGLLAGLAVLSLRQLPIWQNQATILQEIRSRLAPGDVPAIRDLRPALWLYRSGDYTGAFELLDHEIQARGRVPALTGLRQELAAEFVRHRRLAESLGLTVQDLPPVSLMHQDLAREYLRAGEPEPAAWHLAEIRRLAPAYYARLTAPPTGPAADRIRH
jgi:hypothetical protein